MATPFVSDTGIANMALSHVGANDIESLSTGKEAEAVQCRVWYDYSRRQVLEAYDWNFARKRLTMALHGDTISETTSDPMAGVWGFRYQYPGDCVMARKIQNPNAPPGDATPFDVETSLNGTERTILTDLQDAVLVYTWDLKNTDMFSALFVLAFSHLLASKIAFSLTGKRKLVEDQFRLFRNVMPTAMASNANEGVSSPPREAESIRGRA